MKVLIIDLVKKEKNQENDRVVIFGTSYSELSAIERQYKNEERYLVSKIIHVSDIETILEKDEMTTINADNLIY